jgi:hypothetical protein
MLRTEAHLHYDEVALSAIDSVSSITMREALSPNSFRMSDSDAGGLITMDQDSGTSPLTFSTMDEHRYQTLFDSENSADSAHYPFQHV